MGRWTNCQRDVHTEVPPRRFLSPARSQTRRDHQYVHDCSKFNFLEVCLCPIINKKWLFKLRIAMQIWGMFFWTQHVPKGDVGSSGSGAHSHLTSHTHQQPRALGSVDGNKSSISVGLTHGTSRKHRTGSAKRCWEIVSFSCLCLTTITTVLCEKQMPKSLLRVLQRRRCRVGQSMGT